MTPSTRVPLRVSDRGSTAVETAVLVGLALVLLLTVVQAGLWWHTRSLCLHAAQHGLHTARLAGASLGSGDAAAREFLARSPSAARDAVVTTTRSGDELVVRVEAAPPRILPIPGLDPRTDAIARAQRERFTTPGGGP